MFGWLKSFFSSTDRVTAAGERCAKAAEDIADAMEQARDQFRARLGIEAPAPVVVSALPARDEDEASPAKRGRGKG
jgi:hypothetical protein